MQKVILLILLLVSVVGCRTMPTGRPYNTLEGNPDLPHREIRDFYGINQWERIGHLPFDGYVILRGNIQNDRSVTIRKIIKSHPDQRRNELAETFATRARLTPTTVGSRIRPSADIYVVFFETHSTPNRALVFAKQRYAAPPTEVDGGDRFMTIWVY